jgi:hypothetical protein
MTFVPPIVAVITLIAWGPLQAIAVIVISWYLYENMKGG